MAEQLHVVTGALGYSGRAIAERLLARGDRVRTLTNSTRLDEPLARRLEIHPLAFDDRAALTESLRGAATLINTYWVRFNHRRFNFDQAVRNTKVLFEAARDAGVNRIVHTSILKPEEGQGLAYYEGKLELERALRELRLPFTILRPGVLFGRGDILVNNIAWVLRHLPIFGLFGDGRYRLAPLHVDDFAAMAVEAIEPHADEVIDCHGPETFEYRELVRMLARALRVRARLVVTPPLLGYAVSKMLNPLLRDVVITREEISGLMRGLLWSAARSRGTIKLSEWAAEHRAELGVRYHSELARRRR